MVYRERPKYLNFSAANFYPLIAKLADQFANPSRIYWICNVFAYSFSNNYIYSICRPIVVFI